MTVFPQSFLSFKRRRSRKGFSLVEVLLALAVLGMAILTIVGLLNAAFASVSSNLQTSQALAVYTRIDRAFSNVREFVDNSGQAIVSESEIKNKPQFDLVYDWVRDKTGGSQRVRRVDKEKSLLQVQQDRREYDGLCQCR